VTGPSKSGRRRDERSAGTRRRLLEATFESLIEVGFARTSTPEVLRRTGISRGALLHHFPTKNDLVAAAVEYVFDKRLTAYREAFANLELPEGASRAEAAIDLLWELVCGPTYYAWLELLVAARTEPELLGRLKAIDERFDRRAGDIRSGFFPPPDSGEDAIYKVALRFVFATLNGLALVGIHEDKDQLTPVVESLKQLARMVEQSRGRNF